VKFTTTNGTTFSCTECASSWAPGSRDRPSHNLSNAQLLYRRGLSSVRAQFSSLQVWLSGQSLAIGQMSGRAPTLKTIPVKHGNTKGTLVFATAGPNTRTTQFFINFADNTPCWTRKGLPRLGQVVSWDEYCRGLVQRYGGESQAGRHHHSGKAYLDQIFPKIDSIKSATIEGSGPRRAAREEEVSDAPGW